MWGESSEEGCTEISTYMSQVDDWTRHAGVQRTFFSLYGLIFLMGFLGNLLLILNIVRRGRLKMVPNIFLVNLSLSDLLLCIVAVPIAPVTIVHKRWGLGEFLCSAVPFVQGVTVIISSFGLVCIAVDRYRNIARMRTKPWSPAFALLLTGLTWALAAGLNAPSSTTMALQRIPSRNGSFYCGRFCVEAWGGDVGWKKAFGALMLSLQFLFPTAAMLFCYTGIWRKIRRDMLISAVAGEVQRLRAAQRRTRVLTVLVLMVLAFLLSWAPLSLVNVLRDFDATPDLFARQPYLAQLLVHSIAMTSVFWNPLLYFWLNFPSSGRRRRSRGSSVQLTRVGSQSNGLKDLDGFGGFLTRSARFSQWGRRKMSSVSGAKLSGAKPAGGGAEAALLQRSLRPPSLGRRKGQRLPASLSPPPSQPSPHRRLHRPRPLTPPV